MKRFFLILIQITLAMFCFSQNNSIYWDYPVKPGTNAWTSLKTSQEMIDACQIPVDILPILSTESLAELCLNYPLIGDMLLTNNFQEGFDKLSAIFNGFQELYKREDAGTVLLNIYQKFDLNLYHKNKGKIIKNVFYDMCVEIVIAQPVFLGRLSFEHERILMSESLNKLKIRQQYGDSYYRQKTTTVILNRLLTKNNSAIKEFDIQGNDKFLLLNNFYILEDESLIEKIKLQAEKYINENQ